MSQSNQTFLTDEQIKQALENCAKEPIHIPGSIQPYGMLVVIAPDGTIEQMSANALEFFEADVEALLDTRLPDLIGAEAWGVIERLTQKVGLTSQATVIAIDGKTYDVILHHSGKSIILEFEEISHARPENPFYDELRNFAVDMREARNLQQLFDHVTQSVRAITGFDRVKLYRFESDWHGQVVAESRAEFMSSYLGLHFPASDIPPQARQLYLQNHLRHIADTHYKPVPIIPAHNPTTNAPLDLSLSVLRSVSPMCLLFLRNMDVHATMVVSVIQNGKLWGLISCHHSKPMHVPYRVRIVAEIMGHIFSAQVSSLSDIAAKDSHDKRMHMIRKLSSLIDNHLPIDQLMADLGSLGFDAVNASGMAIKTGTQISKSGDVPDELCLQKLAEWLPQHDSNLFDTDDAAAIFHGMPEMEKMQGGFLALPISTKSHDYIMWFRHPIVHEVKWAGPPEKHVEKTEAGYRCTPRASFDLWKEEVKTRSEPWSSEDIETARNIAHILLEGEKLSADRANLAKSEFLANMSHEIRTPMNAVIGIANILARSKPLTTKQLEFIKTLQMSADSLMALINDLLDISKIEARCVDLEAIPFSFTQIIDEVISIIDVRAKEKNLQFTYDTDCVRNRLYFGDPARIRQIILNLCSNAIKFTERGNVHVSIECDENEGGVEKVTIAVQDTGIGIRADKLDTIFMKFAQADNSISRHYGGSGLGLTITKMLVEAMKGTIKVESELGMGSTFTVTLRLKNIATDKTHAAETAEAIPGHKEDSNNKSVSILLAEDNEANILVATTFLEAEGYKFDVARTGEEAFHKAMNTLYDVILMDVQMPHTDGFEATMKIREAESKHQKPYTPIIGMTAHALKGDKELCLNAGMDDYISKPISNDLLKEKLAYHATMKKSARY